MPKSPKTIYIGIDPSSIGGKNTGGAIVGISGGEILTTIFLAKQTERDVWDSFKTFIKGHKVFVCMEQVASRPGQGVVSMFKFGQGYGFLTGLVTALEIPFITVSPQKWQKQYVTASTKDTKSKTEHKNKLKAKAQSLYPKTKITLQTADAILIADYCKNHIAQWKK